MSFNIFIQIELNSHKIQLIFPITIAQTTIWYYVEIDPQK